MNKPILCFNIGFIPDINDEETKNTYGSEIALVNLCKYFSEKYDIYVFGEYIKIEKNINNVNYLNANKFDNFQNKNSIDILILLRHIYPFLNYKIKAKKIYLWIQDIYPLSYYKGLYMRDNGKSFLKNILNKIDKIVVLSNWHKKTFMEYYNISEEKIKIIGNGINLDIIKEHDIKKQENKFIWTSHGYRGIEILIDYFHDIKKIINNAELYIYRDRTAFSDDIFDEINKYDYIHYGGKLKNEDLIKEFLTSDFWFYPTHFDETYCISALEAQLTKCVCVATNKAALKETIGDRGILIDEIAGSYKHKIKSIDSIISLSQNKELKEKYRKLGYDWAIEQTWRNRSYEWYKLFNE